jgi:membrane protein
MTRLQPRKSPHPRCLEIARRVWKEADADNIPGLAAQVAFYFSLALFPFFIFLAAVAGTLPFTGLWGRILGWVLVYLPNASRRFVFDTISGLTHGHARFLSIGLLGTVWATCSGLMNLTCCLNAAYEVKETRSYWRRLAIALMLTTVLAFVMVGSFALLTADTWIDKWVGVRDYLIPSWPFVWQAARWLVSLALLGLGISVVDNVLPNLRRPWQWLSPGTVFVAATWVPATLGFNLYVQRVASYDKTYGSLGAFVILMVWIYVASLLTLIGAQLNSELRKMRSEPTYARDLARPPSLEIKT